MAETAIRLEEEEGSGLFPHFTQSLLIIDFFLSSLSWPFLRNTGVQPGERVHALSRAVSRPKHKDSSAFEKLTKWPSSRTRSYK